MIHKIQERGGTNREETKGAYRATHRKGTGRYATQQNTTKPVCVARLRIGRTTCQHHKQTGMGKGPLLNTIEGKMEIQTAHELERNVERTNTCGYHVSLVGGRRLELKHSSLVVAAQPAHVLLHIHQSLERTLSYAQVIP